MNSNALSKIGMALVMLPLICYIAFDVFTAGGNTIGRLFLYLGIAGGIMGLLAPRPTFQIMLFLTFYLDFFKRMLIFDAGRVSQMDLYYILGVAPITFSGIVAAVLYQILSGTLRASRGLTLMMVAIAVIVPIGILAGYLTGGGGRALGDGVNTVIYLFLIPVVPVFYRTWDEVRHLLRQLIWISIPAAIYMTIHFLRGQIFDWELDYIQSGLSIEYRQLFEKTFRPFGTFNSAANASVILSVISALIISKVWSAPGHRTKFFFLLLPVYLVACYATLSRMGWFIGVFSIGAAWLFMRRSTTILSYALAAAVLVSIVAATPYLLKYKVLNDLSSKMWTFSSADRWAQTINLSTLNDRLEGYYTVATDSRAWTPFGQGFAGRSTAKVTELFRVHDAFSGALLKFGFIPLGGILGFALFCLWRIHSLVLRISDRNLRWAAAVALGIAMSIVSGGAVNGSQLMTYPNNFYIYFFFGVSLSVCLIASRERLEMEQLLAALPEDDPSGHRGTAFARRRSPQLAGHGR